MSRYLNLKFTRLNSLEGDRHFIVIAIHKNKITKKIESLTLKAIISNKKIKVNVTEVLDQTIWNMGWK